MSNTKPAVVSNTLVISKKFTPEMCEKYHAHDKLEARSMFICKEEQLTEIFIDLTDDADIADSVLHYLRVRANLGMPARTKHFTVTGHVEDVQEFSEELSSLGYLVN